MDETWSINRWPWNGSGVPPDPGAWVLTRLWCGMVGGWRTGEALVELAGGFWRGLVSLGERPLPKNVDVSSELAREKTAGARRTSKVDQLTCPEKKERT